MFGSKVVREVDVNAKLIFILVCACLVAGLLQAAVGVVAGDLSDPTSWFDGR